METNYNCLSYQFYLVLLTHMREEDKRRTLELPVIFLLQIKLNDVTYNYIYSSELLDNDWNTDKPQYH